MGSGFATTNAIAIAIVTLVMVNDLIIPSCASLIIDADDFGISRQLRGHLDENDTKDLAVATCACSPAQYTFTFDFDLTCPPVNITRNNAVIGTSCFLSTVEPDEVHNFNFTEVKSHHRDDINMMDTSPVRVSNFDVLELDRELDIIYREPYAGPFLNGDTFVFESIISRTRSNDSIDDDRLPSILQINMFGVNAHQQDVVNVLTILFSNDCHAYPSLLVGQSGGWLRLSSLKSPSSEVCPVVPTDRAPPTASSPPSQVHDESHTHPSMRPSLSPVAASASSFPTWSSSSMSYGTSSQENWSDGMEFGREVR